MAAMEISMSENAELAERCKSQAQAAATNALQSEQAAKEAQAASEAARAGAETAESQAGLYAQRAEEDKDTVEQAKAVVMQLGREVTNNKDSVEKTTQGFALLAEQKTADINNAGQAQYDRIEEAREQAVGEIGTAKTQAVQAVQQEGATQMQNVQEAAAAIEADREQIEINRAGIAALQEEAGNDAPGTACAASGKTILATDSSSKCFRGLRLYGRTIQETTTGAQLLNPDLYQLRTINGVTFTKDDYGRVIASGESTGNAVMYLGEYANLLEDGKEYSFHGGTGVNIEHVDGTVSYDKIFIVNKEYMESIRPYIQISAGIVANNTIYEPMLHAGSTTLPWEPYTGGTPSPNPDYPQELVSAGDKGSIEVDVLGGNLLNPKAESTGTINGITFIDNEDGTYNVTGTATSMAQITIGRNLSFKKGTYTISDAKIYTNEAGWFDGMKSPATITFESDWTCTQAFIQVQAGETINKTFYPMLHLGSTHLSWEPYKEKQSITIFTPNGLPGIPVSSGGNYTDENGQQWICDEVDLGRGMYVQKIKKYSITGREDFFRNSPWNETAPDIIHTYFYAMDKAITDHSQNAALMCNAFKAYVSNGTTHVAEECVYANYANNSIYIFMRIDRLNTPDIAGVQAYLQDKYDTGTPVTVLYQLATPIETPIPADELAAYQALHTNTPTTTITNDEDCWMEVGYTADTKAHIEQNYVPKESYMALEKRVAALETQAIENI